MDNFLYEKPFLHYIPWQNAGIRHGFTDNSLNFKETVWQSGWKQFITLTGVKDLLVDRQVHEAEVVDLRNKDLLTKFLGRDKDAFLGRTGVEADALIAPPSFLEGKIAIGVTAADCIPVLVKSDFGYAAIHAGWRGLALGIVPKAINNLLGGKTDSPIEVVVGPCAGKNDYEVGPEVIEAFGTAKHTVLPNGKSLLDLVGTLEANLTAGGFNFSFAACGISTIADSRFFSHRRDGEAAGRAIGFIIP